MRWIFLLPALFLATTLWAHSGVQNAAVMHRMHLMDALDDALVVLEKMARGQRAYDAAEAALARDTLIAGAAETVARFEARETDPKMEALPILWDEFDAFSVSAMDMQRAAEALQLPPSRGEVRAIAGTCRACHDAYRAD